MEDLGLFIVRVIIGLIFVGHGAQKLFGWFGGYGPKATGGWFESIGVKPGILAALSAGIVEFVGGLFFAIGLFTPVVAILLIATMIVAIVKVHGKNGLWVTANGYEYNLVLIAVFLGITLIGAGEYSLDAWIK